MELAHDRHRPGAFFRAAFRIRARIVPDVNGLSFHILEAGWSGSERPTVLLLHGFPEIAYSWRKVMGLLVEAGYHVIAPDQRGYGRTSPTPIPFDDDLAPFGSLIWCATW